MANQNVTQLTQQTTSANTTSVFYAVINGTTDTGLPFSVLVNNLGLTGTPTTPTAALNTNTTQIASTSFVMNQVALYAPLTGATFTGAVVIPTVTIQGGTVNAASIGATTPSTGAFTTLSASSTVSGVGFSTYLASPPAIGGTAANTGAFTTLSASGTVSGTGFSTYLASPPAIGTTTPAAGKFTTLQATGAITPSTTAGIVGTTLADNANSGSVGEYVTATASSLSLTSNVGLNITSISLTAGDWDVSGTVQIVGAASTSLNNINGGISTTSATIGGLGTYFQVVPGVSNTAALYILTTPNVRINITTTTTVFLVAFVGFSTSTATAGGLIRARRVR